MARRNSTEKDKKTRKQERSPSISPRNSPTSTPRAADRIRKWGANKRFNSFFVANFSDNPLATVDNHSDEFKNRPSLERRGSTTSALAEFEERKANFKQALEMFDSQHMEEAETTKTDVDEVVWDDEEEEEEEDTEEVGIAQEYEEEEVEEEVNLGPRSWNEVDLEELEQDCVRIAAFSVTSRVGGSGTEFDEEEVAIAAANEAIKDPLGLGHVDPERILLMSADESRRRRDSYSSMSSLRRVPEDEEKTLTTKRRGLFGLRGQKKDKLAARSQRRRTTQSKDTRGKETRQQEEKVDKNQYLLVSEEFDPLKYLCRVHAETPFKKLQGGVYQLQTELSERAGQLKKLITENFERFISSKNIIDNVHERLQEDSSYVSEDGELTALGEALRDAQQAAMRAFKPLLKRQSEADKLRKVLASLRKSERLFAAPARLRYHIRRGEPEQAIQEYQRALLARQNLKGSHYLKGELQTQIQQELIAPMRALQNQLYKRMEEPLGDLHEAETAITLSISLNEMGIHCTSENAKVEENGDDSIMDSIDHFLEQQTKRICTALLDVKFHNKNGSNKNRRLRRRSSAQETLAQAMNLLNVNTTTQSKPQLSGAAAWVQYMEELCNVLEIEVVAFRQACTNIANQGNSNAESGELAQNDTDSQSKPHTITTTIEKECVAGFIEIFKTVDGLANRTVDDIDLNEVDVSQIRMLVENIDKLRTLFSDLKVSNSALLVMAKTAKRISDECITQYSHKLISNLLAIIDEEDWVVMQALELVDETRLCVTSVPYKMQSLLANALNELSIICKTASLRGAMTLRLSFFQAFEDVADKIAQTACSQLDENPEQPNSARSETLHKTRETEESAIGTRDLRLLLAMTNCKVLWSSILPHTFGSYVSILSTMSGFDKTKEDPGLRNAVKLLRKAEEDILSLSIERICQCLLPVVRAYMGDSDENKVDWTKIAVPVGIRNVIMNIIVEFNRVHEHVYKVAPPFTSYLISFMVTYLFQTMKDIVCNLSEVSVNGYIQLMLEMEYLSKVFKEYCEDASTKDRLGELRREIYSKVRVHLLKVDTNELPPAMRELMVTQDLDVKLAMREYSKATISRILPREIKRTYMNTLCFTENTSDELLTRYSPISGA